MAVISDDDLDPRLDDLLKHALALGALSSVKLIAVEDTQLYVLLESSVSSSSFPAVESLWQQVTNKHDDQIWSLAFSNVSEVLSGHSDYANWAYAKQIIAGLIDAELAMSQAPSPWDVSTPAPAIGETFPYLPKRVRDTFLLSAVSDVHYMDSRARRAFNDENDIDGEESFVVPEAKSTEALRERCIHELLNAGVRPLELRQMKVGLGSEINVPIFKARIGEGRDSNRILSLSRDAEQTLSKYISAARLSEGHYLFPSTGSPSDEMSNRGFRKVLGSWRVVSVRNADDQLAKITKSQRSLLADAGTIEWLIGHVYQGLLQHYLKDAKPAP
ncbi:hypothetical protein [Pseudomonas sp. W5-01]|uniref:hypothetical protein n=1 Tax=Pseudomonas sp. W5-01 TaxID=3097454 RepID=UPI00397DE06B